MFCGNPISEKTFLLRDSVLFLHWRQHYGPQVNFVIIKTLLSKTAVSAICGNDSQRLSFQLTSSLCQLIFATHLEFPSFLCSSNAVKFVFLCAAYILQSIVIATAWKRLLNMLFCVLRYHGMGTVVLAAEVKISQFFSV